jgi:hypothetical protein
MHSVPYKPWITENSTTVITPTSKNKSKQKPFLNLPKNN